MCSTLKSRILRRKQAGQVSPGVPLSVISLVWTHFLCRLFLFCGRVPHCAPKKSPLTLSCLSHLQVIEFDDGSGSVLRIQPLRTPRDEAIYECVASNSVGETSATTRLTVLRGRSSSTPLRQFVEKLDKLATWD